MPLIKTAQFTLAPKQAYKLYSITLNLADALEDILESHGAYSAEFIKGLKLSQKQAKSGKLKKINSLAGLR